MGETTTIAWTDHTFNPWIGCSKVHTGCTNCYAEADFDKRRHIAKWGEDGTRILTNRDYWKQPLKWNAQAEQEGVRRKVFCASLSDFFEDWPHPLVDYKGNPLTHHEGLPIGLEGGGKQVPVTMSFARRSVFNAINETPWLDWLILTKRPENIRRLWPRADIFDDESEHKAYWPNVWIGTSISDQATADKAVPELIKCRDLAPILFLSAEPLVGPIEWNYEWNKRCAACEDAVMDPTTGMYDCNRCDSSGYSDETSIDWVIAGGESGPGARVCEVEWLLRIKEECEAMNVPCFVKQLGSNPTYLGVACPGNDRKGGDPYEWPPEVRVQQFPEVAR